MASPKVREVMTDKELAKANSNDGQVAVRAQRFDDDQLLAIQSFDDALTLLANEGIVVDHADEVLGNGFAIISDKGILVGVEMLFLSWQFNQGDQGEFVSINAVAKFPGQKSPAKYVINDGSTGIMKDLKRYTEKTGKTAGLHIKRGLRRSDYDYEDPNTGEKTPATTFYLDLSA